MSVIEEVAAERQRQQEVEGWSPQHDDAHVEGEMAEAAACYAIHTARFRDAEEHGVNYATKAAPWFWPWERRWWKPKDRRRDLIRAAALIVAEVERLDRAASAKQAA